MAHPEHIVLIEGELGGFVHRERTNRRAVVLVHGFGGDWEATWRGANGSPTFLELISRDPDLADYDVFAFRYRTSFFRGDQVESVASQLHDAVRVKLAAYQVVFLAHSLGGLVCMRYILNRLAKGDSPPVRGLLLYGTPTTGTLLVNIAHQLGIPLLGGLAGFVTHLPLIGSAVSWALTGDQAGAMAVHSRFLEDLRDQWALRVVNGGYPEEDARRRMWLPVRVVTGTTDCVVPVYSAKGTYGEIDWHPIAHDHRGLVKPSGHTDVRYLLAQEFLQKCRQARPAEALTQLRTACDDLWQGREGHFIRDWRFDVEIHGATAHTMHPVLKQAGFSPFRAACRYRTILQQRELRVGFAYGRIAKDRVWARQPVYVHQVMDERDSGKLHRAVDAVLRDTTPRDAWDVFFPALSVCLARTSESVQVPLTGTDVQTVGAGLVRTFPIPEVSWDLIGEEVELDITFESVIPGDVPVFYVFFPWLTLGCSAHVTVNGRYSALHQFRREFGRPMLDLQTDNSGHKVEALIRTDDLVLPGSLVELRWVRA
jgi:pimeloyl-ACP methyl ester carboxylesterase